MNNDDKLITKALVTAGPTYEAFDPVRFIGNHSSGKMGIAIAEALAENGIFVYLIKGPCRVTCSHPLISVSEVTSAQEMYHACLEYHNQVDLVVFAAAVADFRPTIVNQQKIKKTGESLTITLARTVDIAKELGKIKKEEQIHVGFALETEDEFGNALMKLTSKNFDFIILNSLNEKGAGFGYDTNSVTIIDKNGNCKRSGLASKREIAHEILSSVFRYSGRGLIMG